jgi:DNA polymerase elongation subunit (family B)
VFDSDNLLALDIETTGLDPETNRLRAIALASPDAISVLISDDEPGLLRDIERFVSQVSLGTTIVTWNGEEFDMPFLAGCFRRTGVRSTLRVRPIAETGKYGGRLFRAEWGGLGHLDIAPFFKKQAESLRVPWSLKPVAHALLGVQPVEVDRSGSAIAQLDEDQLGRYVASDAQITLALARRLVPISEPA